MFIVWVGFSAKSSSGIIHAFSLHPCFLLISSPSQGPCCTAQCNFKLKTDKCRNDSDCAREGMCNGVSALCPASEPKLNFTACNRHTQVCINGVWFLFLQSYATAVVYCEALYYEVIWFQYLMEKSVRISFSIKMFGLLLSIKITLKVHQILRSR